jgi:hypothetical protein
MKNVRIIEKIKKTKQKKQKKNKNNDICQFSVFCDHDFCKSLEVLLQSCDEYNPIVFPSKMRRKDVIFNAVHS